MMLALLILVVSVALYFLYIQPQKYWKDRNVPFEKPIPIFGNMARSITGIEQAGLFLQRMYNKFPNSRYFGFFNCLTPALVIRDPELLKRITIKDFEAFHNHRAFSNEEIDPLASIHLFAIQDINKWRRLRATLSSLFTSRKMKMMFNLLNKCAEDFVSYYRQDEEIIKVDVKDAFTRYANDIIASTAFGITVNSQMDRTNEFFLMGKDVSNFFGIKFFIYSISPTLMKLLNITMFSKNAISFFRKVIKDSIQMKEQDKIPRPDLIHHFMEARKGKKSYEVSEPISENSFAAVEEFVHEDTDRQNDITDDYITSQAMVFFLAGFDTVSNLMSFTSIELAAHPEIQERLAQEIDCLNKRCGGNPVYEDIMHLKYFDMVISESLRKWPPAMGTDRKCAKPYTIQPERKGEIALELDIGANVWIPIYAIHRDENYYPDPEKFDPERFSDENKGNIKPFTYLPFGAGPRNCIASRLALLETKIILYHILTNFEIVPIEETVLPITLSPKHISPVPKAGYMLGLKKRTK